MAYPGRSREEQIRVLQRAIDEGITSIDTAPLYEAGESERLVGQAIAGRRDSVQILTKCGLRWDDEHGQPMFTMLVNGRQCVVRKDGRPISITIGIDESLRRLRIEAIDLMQIHQLDESIPLDETMEALLAARAAGKIRAIGVSNFPLAKIREARAILDGSLYSTQDQFHMLDADRSLAIRAFAKESGMAFLAYSPLAQGVLSGTFSAARRPTDWRSGSRFLKAGSLARINSVLDEHARPLALAHNVGISTVCLAWALAQHGVTSVVTGASSEEQCRQNAAAMSLELPPDAANALGQAMAACGMTAPGLLERLVTPMAKLARRIRRRL
jgi:aryl-alcohol dehydrogenase-like predicted oxidoreductase